MGEMADMALEHVLDEEFSRIDYVMGDMSQQEAYDRGYIDELGYEQEGISQAWKNAPNPWELDQELVKAEAEFGSNLSKLLPRPPDYKKALIKTCKKHKLKHQMMKGMAAQVYLRGNLTEKQQKWIETNYNGGAEKFLLDMKEEENYIKVSNWCDKIIEIAEYE